MIFIPIFMNKPSIGFNEVSEEDKERIQNNRDDILNILMVSPSGLTTQEIANRANKDIRQTNAILTVLKKQGLVESFLFEEDNKTKMKYLIRR